MANTLSTAIEMRDNMLTIKEAAAKSGLSVHFVRQLCIENRIVNVRAGKKYLINLTRLTART